jgi:signal transduction histidine kinase
METLTFVILEDEEAHFSLMKRALAKDLPHAVVYHFQDPITCLKRLDEIVPTAIITDYRMPGLNGLEFLEALNQQNLDIPVIMVTGQGDEDIAVRAMKLGARDYLVKSGDFFTLLPSVIEKVVHEKKTRDALRAAEEKYRTDRKRADEQIHTLTQELMRYQENERQMISRELHDSIAQDLSWLKIGCATLFDYQPPIPAEIKQKVAEFSKVLHKIITSVRDLSYLLRPSGLDQLGIVQSISEYCDDFAEKTGLKVNFTAAGMDVFQHNDNININLFRLVQEGLNNIRKHAEAGQSTVKLISAYPNIILSIEDDGKGFDVKEQLATMNHKKRMGLQSMQERAMLLGGKIAIQSQPGKGTKIVVKVPCANTENDTGTKI